MLSVYFHAHYASSQWLPEEFRPIGLVEAARVLRANEDQFAESRRRRAIARLAAAGLDDPNRRKALEILGAPIKDLEDLLRKVAAAAVQHTHPAPPFGATDSRSHGSGVRSDARSMTVEEIVAAILAMLEQRLGPAIPGCEGTSSVDVQFDPTTWETTATARASVKRDLSDVCEAMDPQHWDDCSDYFAETHVALKVGTVYPILGDYTVAPDPNPPAPCTSYTRELFERFDVAFKAPLYSNLSVTPAWYKQLLTIDSGMLPSTATDPREGHVYGYKLYQAIRSRVGFDERDGGLAKNGGAITIQRRVADASWTDLELTKTVRFSGRPLWDTQLNLWSGVLLEAMGDELYAMACCRPGAATPP